MKTFFAALMAALLSLVLVTAATADEDPVLKDLVADIESAMVDVRSELDAIDERIESDDWMVFGSKSRGLVQVDLGEIRPWVPIVRTLRAIPVDPAGSDTISALAMRVPKLWEAAVLLGGAPSEVLDQGPDATDAWLREHYAHLQTPEQKRDLYEAHRIELQEQLEALRVSHEVFSAELLAQSAGSEIEPAATAEPETEPDAATAEPETEQTGAATATMSPETADTETPMVEGDCGFGDSYWEPDHTVTHGRWNGVWDQYGDDDIGDLTLTQSGHCVLGTYDYEGWSLWLRLMVTDEQELHGYWFSADPNHRVTCEYQRDGVDHWGEVSMRFDEDFTEFWGHDGACGGTAAGVLTPGERVR